MIIPDVLLARVVAHAERAYPEECCGLLAGTRRNDGSVLVRLVEPAPNVTAGRRADSFEIDPGTRFALMRRLRQEGGTIVGHYHSHPDQPARPSPRDLRDAHEPDLLWLILAVHAGRVVDRRAFRLDASRERFNEIPVRIVDDAPGQDAND